MSYARCAVIGCAVRHNSSVAASPICFGKMLPKGGSKLHFVSVIPNLASAAATRKSHIWAIDQPPASANPLIAAISGFQVCGHIYGRSGYILSPARACRPSALSLARSFKSRPAQKARPAPVMMPARAALSRSNSTMASASSCRSCRLMEFNESGRFRVMVTMLPCCS